MISMMLGMNLGKWQQMKTPTMVIEMRVSLEEVTEVLGSNLRQKHFSAKFLDYFKRYNYF